MTPESVRSLPPPEIKQGNGFKYIEVEDRRKIAFKVSDDKNGVPIFLLHGSPGSKIGPNPDPGLLYHMGIKLITYDRPGNGDSDRQKGRIIANTAKDVAAIADALGIEKFRVAGRSGGGGHALGCAALLGDRVVRAAELVGLAPIDAEGLDWYEGMSEDNIAMHKLAIEDPERLYENLKEIARGGPDALMKSILAQIYEADKPVISSLKFILKDSYGEALKHGVDGWYDDIQAAHQPWGIDLKNIKQKVKIWHGEDDTFSPVGHAKWLAGQIENSELELVPNVGHFKAFDATIDILAWLRND